MQVYVCFFLMAYRTFKGDIYNAPFNVLKSPIKTSYFVLLNKKKSIVLNGSKFQRQNPSFMTYSLFKWINKVIVLIQGLNYSESSEVKKILFIYACILKI